MSDVEAELRAAIDVLKQECDDWKASAEFERDVHGNLLQSVEQLRAQLAGAEAANAAIDLVEHVELNGHIDVAEQCRDHLMAIDNGDWGGKLQDFADSLRIVIDQLDRQRRSRNWYEVAYQAGKQKLIEYALAKQAERLDAYKAMLVEILASAHPHPREHPTMHAAWTKARALLAKESNNG